MRTSQSLEKPPLEKPLICRPNKEWLMVSLSIALFLAFMGILSQRPDPPNSLPPSPLQFWFLAGSLLVYGLISVCGAWSVWHRDVEASSQGLTVRGFFKSHFYEWSAIEDYELRPSKPEHEKKPPFPCICVGNEWHLLPGNFEPRDALLERIVLEARWSRATRWELYYLRKDGIWPKTFVYPPSSLNRQIVLYALPFLWLEAFPLFMLASFKLLSTQLIHAADFDPDQRRMFIRCLMLPPLAALIGAMANSRTFLLRKRFSSVKITATLEGLHHTNQGIVTEMAWEEIQTIQSRPVRGFFHPSKPCIYSVESGYSHIEFFTGIRGEKELWTLVQDRAKNAGLKY